MRTLFGICLAAILAVGSAQAANWKVSVYGGYGAAAGGGLNDRIGDLETMGYETTEVSSVIPLGVEIMHSIGGNLWAGVRAGYAIANEASASYYLSMPFMFWTLEQTVDYTYNASAIPVLLGIRYAMPSDGKFGLNAGLFAGISTISLDQTMDREVTLSGTTIDSLLIEESGSDTGLGVAILVGGTMKMGEKTELGLDVGYQMNSVDMEYFFLSGVPVKDSLDLGGLIVTLSIGMLF